MIKQMTWEQAIDQVLSESPTPLHYSEISERIIKQGHRSSLGATPAATVAAVITSSIKHDGLTSPYVRVGKGIYALKRSSPQPASSQVTTLAKDLPSAEEDQIEEQYDIVSSFGMFWRRELVEWVRTPRILGQQYGATSVVDFARQRGVYLLYDGREVIYVGRANERGLGTRLSEHTWDRLSARWDRFSWFGLLPVSDAGMLGNMPLSFDASKMIAALEAILVEALEPRQNRKRGDDLMAVEYIQQEDPAVKKRKLKAAVEEAFNRS